MGCSIKAYYDDLDDYHNLCKLVGVNPDDNNMYNHENEILKSYNVKTHYELYNIFRMINVRNEKIDDILK